MEVAEDYAVLAQDALKVVQVKDTAASVTLNSPPIRAAIESYWEFQKSNPDRVVRLEYLTTANSGKEKSLQFPDSQPGLQYWRAAAREHCSVEPVRQALLTLDLRQDLKTFIEQTPAEDLRNRLLRRIRWECGTGDTDSIDRTIRDRLVYLGDRKGLLPGDSERARDALIVEILRVIVRKRARELTRADLLRIFGESVAVPMSISAVRQTLSQAISRLAPQEGVPITPQTSVMVDVRQAPLPPRLAERAALVKKLLRKVAQVGSLWLRGSSGLGKTVLAQLIARKAQREWFIVELRGHSPTEIEYRLRSALIDTRDFGPRFWHALASEIGLTASQAGRVSSVPCVGSLAYQ